MGAPAALMAEVRTFLNSDDARLRELLASVRRECELVRDELGATVVRNVYGRDDKQITSPFKTPEKIAIALSRLREGGRQVPVSAVQDIIGLTVVVYYPDEIARVRDALIQKLGLWSTITKNEPVTRNGYYAHHVVIHSSHRRTADLHCEIQIKTMLHDAWAAKTHDLTYKPSGHMDDRLERLMQAFGDALEATEKQSEMLRNLIQERWKSESELRREVRRRFSKWLPDWGDQDGFSEHGKRILERLDQDGETISSAPADDRMLIETAKEINEVASKSAREGAWLAIQLAIARGDADHSGFADLKVAAFIKEAIASPQCGSGSAEELWTIPLAMDTYGNLEGAIESSRFLLNLEEIGEEARLLIRFNLANFLIERACLSSPKSNHERATLRAEIEGLLNTCTELEKRDLSAFCDAKGMLDVALSDSPVTVRKAIDLVQRGRDEAPDPDREFADATFEVHVRLAWRRLLDLEARAAKQPS
jgi:ppGpp synthetase/RelA/SpoT-type nucleotidyltranferase